MYVYIYIFIRSVYLSVRHKKNTKRYVSFLSEQHRMVFWDAFLFRPHTFSQRWKRNTEKRERVEREIEDLFYFWFYIIKKLQGSLDAFISLTLLPRLRIILHGHVFDTGGRLFPDVSQIRKKKSRSTPQLPIVILDSRTCPSTDTEGKPVSVSAAFHGFPPRYIRHTLPPPLSLAHHPPFFEPDSTYSTAQRKSISETSRG